MKQTLILTAIIVLLISKPLSAQEEEQKEERFIGISATIQQGQWGLQFPIWFSKDFSLAPSIAILASEGNGKDYSLSFNPRYYFKNESVSPFLSARAGIIYNVPPKDLRPFRDTYADFVTGFGFGIDYFFKPKFSVGVEAQGNFTKSDENSQRFGNPGGWNFNTAAVVSVSIYY